jgi:hypothetical protein
MVGHRLVSWDAGNLQKAHQHDIQVAQGFSVHRIRASQDVQGESVNLANEEVLGLRVADELLSNQGELDPCLHLWNHTPAGKKKKPRLLIR